MRAEKKSPAWPRGAVTQHKQSPQPDYIDAGGAPPGAWRRWSGDCFLSWWEAPDMTCRATKRHLISKAWSRSKDSGLRSMRVLDRPGAAGVPIFRVTSIAGAVRNLLAWDRAGRLHFLYDRARLRDSVKFGHVDSRLVIAERLADGFAIHQATGHAVLVVFNRTNLRAIGVDRIRARWSRQLLILAPSTGYGPATAVGLSEPAAIARALSADLAIPAEGLSWSEQWEQFGSRAVSRTFQHQILPLARGGSHERA